MIAAGIFNEQKGNRIPSVYGIVTTGTNWRFLKLEDMLYIDVREYYIEQLGKIMGIMLQIIHSVSGGSA